MADRIIKKKYCRITFTLASPLAVGSGTNESSDKDIIRDSQGIPYIPASAMAGVCRSFFPRTGKDAENTGKYFGNVVIHSSDSKSADNKSSNRKKTEDRIESSLIFYDATIINQKGQRYYTSIRDSVKLDLFKNAEAGAKFDMEVLEPGISFRTYLEQNFGEGKEEDYVQEVVKVLRSGQVCFGAKTMRGYGAIRDVKAEFLEFPLNSKDSKEIRRWIDFDLYDDVVWKNASPCEAGSGSGADRQLILDLRLRGGISVRKYTTEVKKDDGKAVPDFAQMTVRVSDSSSDESKEIPVVPGTSWAGALRHRMRELGLKEEEEHRLFGFVKGGGAGDKARSVIRFGESQITGGRNKILSRNAIDRFSGGTVDGALFTERTYYGGNTQLVISFSNGAKVDEWTRTHLAAALTDLHYGFLAVGGETSVGRGLFRITAVNGQQLSSEDNVYEVLDAALEASLSDQGKEGES